MKRTPYILIVVSALLLFVGCEPPTSPFLVAILNRLIPEVVYVDAAAPEGGDGLSWDTAFKYLQDAMYVVREVRFGDQFVPEIHVAEGVYYPDDAEEPEALLHEWSGEPLKEFLVETQVKLYGGYPSGGGARDPQAHVTVLSGDIDQDDTVDGDGITVVPADIVGTNAESLLGANFRAFVDGFTLTAVAGWSAASALGIASDEVDETEVTMANLVFQGNNCVDGVVLSLSARNGAVLAPHITGLEFRNNIGDQMIGIESWKDTTVGSLRAYLEDLVFEANSGCPVVIRTLDGGTAEVEIVDAVFIENAAAGTGGAINVEAGDGGTDGDVELIVVNATFHGNQAGGTGGAIYFTGTATHSNSIDLVNCVFVGNVATGNGGAIGVSGPVEVGIESCTLTSNEATGNGGGLYLGNADAGIDNSIFWANSAGVGNEIDLGGTAAATFRESDIEGSGGSSSWQPGYGTDGGGNIALDPSFTTTPNAGDGDWTTSGDNNYGNLALQGGSPAGDTGDANYLPADWVDLDDDNNTTEPLPYDIDGSVRVNGGGLDMGAYESL